MRRIVLAVGCLMLAQCSGSNAPQVPNVVLATPAGIAPIYTPNAPGPLPPPTVPQPVDPSGVYAGVAEPLSTGGGICIRPIRMGGFHVQGNTVRFGRFNGAIDAQNGLQMTYAGQWIVGQFEGASFHGQLEVPTRTRFGLGCSYVVTLRRVSP